MIKLAAKLKPCVIGMEACCRAHHLGRVLVELKSEEQLDMQTLHRARDRLVAERTALINQLRAILLERGITVAQGRRRLERHLADMDAQGDLSERMRSLIEDMRVQWSELDRLGDCASSCADRPSMFAGGGKRDGLTVERWSRNLSQ